MAVCLVLRHLINLKTFWIAANCCYLLKKKFKEKNNPLSLVDGPPVNHPTRRTLAVSLHTGAGLLLPPLPAALCQSRLKLFEPIKCRAESEPLLIQQPCTSCTFLPIIAQSDLHQGEFWGQADALTFFSGVPLALPGQFCGLSVCVVALKGWMLYATPLFTLCFCSTAFRGLRSSSCMCGAEHGEG